MENIIYPTTIFQSSSSSSPQSCSHLNMANSHQHEHHHQEFVVYDQIKPNNGYMGGMMITNMETTTTTPTMEENVNDDKKKGEIKNKSKKPKYAFQTRSQVDILDDGYRWRKYGQKAVKNNKFPRSYYRCTHQGCNVKKQVQRLSKDEGVVVTTYEGMHSHQIQKTTENFDHILTQMQINYTSF